MGDMVSMKKLEATTVAREQRRIQRGVDNCRFPDFVEGCKQTNRPIWAGYLLDARRSSHRRWVVCSYRWLHLRCKPIRCIYYRCNIGLVRHSFLYVCCCCCRTVYGENQCQMISYLCAGLPPNSCQLQALQLRGSGGCTCNCFLHKQSFFLGYFGVPGPRTRLPTLPLLEYWKSTVPQAGLPRVLGLHICCL